MTGLDSEEVRHLLQTARAHGLRHVRLKVGDSEFTAVLPARPPGHAVRSSAVVADHHEGPVERDVLARVVGHFQPVGQAPALGEPVRPGQLLGEIVALGLANDVVSDWVGEFLGYCVEPGAAVEYGQPVARVRVG